MAKLRRESNESILLYSGNVEHDWAYVYDIMTTRCILKSVCVALVVESEAFLDPFVRGLCNDLLDEATTHR